LPVWWSEKKRTTEIVRNIVELIWIGGIGLQPCGNCLGNCGESVGIPIKSDRSLQNLDEIVWNCPKLCQTYLNWANLSMNV
jgi:hypothetical protein